MERNKLLYGVSSVLLIWVQQRWSALNFCAGSEVQSGDSSGSCHLHSSETLGKGDPGHGLQIAIRSE